MTIREAKKIAVQKFSSSPIIAVKSTPTLDADLLMSYATGFDRSQIILHRDTELSAEQEHQFFATVAKRETGLPVAYITGHKEFFGLDFIVTPDVLIPKPDTEILVEKTLEIIKKSYKVPVTSYKLTEYNSTFQFSPFSFHLNICDMCTGSGCVGISIAEKSKVKSQKSKERSESFNHPLFNFQLVLADISAAALAVARKNAERLLSAEQLANTKFLQGDLFEAVDNDAAGSDVSENKAKLFDIIISNPPYIPSHMVDELLKDGRSEPRLALDGDTSSGAASLASTQSGNGLAIIRRLVPESFAHLNDGGYFLCETGEYNAHETAELFKATGFSDVEIFYDLAETPRVVCGKKPRDHLSLALQSYSPQQKPNGNL